MPKGRTGQKRPADVIGCAIMVAKIATGELPPDPIVRPLGQAGGQRGGKARAEKLTPKVRKEIAKKAAKTRWKDKKEFSQLTRLQKDDHKIILNGRKWCLSQGISPPSENSLEDLM